MSPTAERVVAYWLAGVLLLATLGQGGARPTSMLVWHGALVALVGVAALWPRGDDGRGRTLPATVLFPAGLFLLLFALGAVRAPYAYGALLVTIELVSCVAVAALAASAGSRALGFLVTPLQVGAAAQGVWVLVQWLRQGDVRPAGTFFNPNHLALWCIAITLLALGVVRVGDHRTDLAWRALLALPAVVAIGVAGSRGAAVGLALGGGWLVWTRRRSLGRGVLAGLVAGIVLVLAFVGWRQLHRLEQPDPFRYQRVKIWTASVGAIAADPWWGTGPGQFSTAAADLAFADGDGPLRYDRAFAATHSDLLRLPAELGIPAALAALFAAGVAVRVLARRRRAGSLPRAADGAMAALIAIVAQGLVDNPSTWPAVYLLACALAGCLLSSEPVAARRLGAGLSVAGAALVVLVFFVADVGPYLAWRTMGRLPAGRMNSVEQVRMARALEWNPIEPTSWMRRADQIAHETEEWGFAAYAVAREAAEHAVRLHPRAAQTRLGLARLEAHACRTLFPDVDCRERVAAHYAEAERLARHDPRLPVGLAAFLLDTGDVVGARRAAERALAIEPESVLPRLLLADAMLVSGTAEGRLRAAELLEDARRRAADWQNWNESAYGRELLVPDPRIFERLEQKLAEAGSPGTPTP